MSNTVRRLERLLSLEAARKIDSTRDFQNSLYNIISLSDSHITAFESDEFEWFVLVDQTHLLPSLFVVNASPES